ncbi:hypothetical protein HA466_0175060 [Hirschfeldia incana]|nr:hypothetical protein HA466_0175060 [Hirschfeldia incana]
MCLFSDLKSGKCSSVVEARLLWLWEAGNVKRGVDLMWVEMFNPQETNCKLNYQNFSGTRKDNQEENPDQASEMAKIGRSSHVTDLMDRFQTLKRREA